MTTRTRIIQTTSKVDAMQEVAERGQEHDEKVKACRLPALLQLHSNKHKTGPVHAHKNKAPVATQTHPSHPIK